MRLPRWLSFRRKQTDLNTVTPIATAIRQPSRFGWIVEAFGGAWQRNLTIDSTSSLLAFAAVFACVSLIAGDIAKLRIRLLRLAPGGIWEEMDSPAFSPVLRKPNRYQTRLQFIQQWMISKLLWGNTYVLKERDQRKIVVALYVLDPGRVVPLVANDGSVYYQVNEDPLAGVETAKMILPASEIIHDRAQCLFHPLIGISPLYAAGAAATQGRRIQENSQTFFENMSRPGGHLTAPGTIADATAERLKKEFEGGFRGAQLGRLFVSGDGLKFEPFTIPADDAQLVEQLKWTGEDVARAFLVPAYKIGLGPAPALGSVEALNQEYYQQVLQVNIEAIEDLLDDGLALPGDLSAEFDLDQLVRMDAKSQAEAIEVKIRSAVLSPNEARRMNNMAPVKGGESPYLQQQNYSLAALAKRDAQEDPFGTQPKPAPTPKPDPAANDGEVDNGAAQEAMKAFEKELLA